MPCNYVTRSHDMRTLCLTSSDSVLARQGVARLPVSISPCRTVLCKERPRLPEIETDFVTAGRHTAWIFLVETWQYERSTLRNWDPGTVCYTRRLANSRRVSGAVRSPPPAALWRSG